MATTRSRPDADPLRSAEGAVGFLLGNEAIVRGALEAGVAFACGYPGTPSSEITDSFARVAPSMGIAFEYSVNEKVALEMAFAASLAGARSIVAMKHLGLTYAGDPLSTIPYVGTVAGMVIVSAGDPSCLTSPNEQDQRHLARMLHIPTLDPSTPQEALEMTRFAFDLSERSGLPVLLRPTTRVCHGRGSVSFGELGEPRVTGFDRDPPRFVPTPGNARRMRVEIKARMEIARALMEESGFCRSEGSGPVAILSTGVPAATTLDLLRAEGQADRVTFLAVGAVHPLPSDWLLEQLADVDRVLVVEELSPFLEDAVRALCTIHDLPLRVLGKRTGHLPEEFEYEPHVIRRALAGLLDLEDSVGGADEAEPPTAPPPRPPILCAGCPHRSTFFAAREVFGSETLYFSDIGCYTLGYGAPLHSADALLCMGAGFTLAAGVSRVTGARTVGFMGDSTFFHSGMPALLNAIKEGANMVAVILDNGVTAMTGFQESPTVDVEDGRIHRTTDIETVVRALGASDVRRVDPHDLSACLDAFRSARGAEGVSVVIADHPCPVFLERAAAPVARPATYQVDHERCQICGRETLGHRCGQCTARPFEEAIARARSMEVGGNGASLPEVAPCEEACPLFLCVKGYVAQIAAGRYAEALELIMAGLPLPESVCRVCHRPCEAVCVRGAIDEPVAINDLKRFVVEWANAHPECRYEPRRDAPNGKRVAVVGAGPAGLACTHELTLRGYQVSIFDGRDEPGGLLLDGIPEYRLPREALRRDVERILALGATFEGGRTLGADLRLSTLLEEFDSVFLATGAPRSQRLEIAGDAEVPVLDALAFLDARPSDNEPLRRRVVVLGGGNSAVDASRVALRRGAPAVTIACLESRDEMPAIPMEIDAAEAEGVEILDRRRANSICDGMVELVRVEPRIPGELAPDNFEPIAGGETSIEAELVVSAIGQRTDPTILAADDPELEWTEGGQLRVDRDTLRTSDPRVFAGGDLIEGEQTVTDAVASGLRAAWGIDAALRGESTADRRRPPPHTVTEQLSLRSGVERVDRGPRLDGPKLDPSTRVGGFQEVVGVLTEEQARAEAARCMFCGQCANCRSCLDLFGCPAFRLEEGRIVISPELCIGCGVCALLCPNQAITAAPGEGLFEPVSSAS